MLNTIRKLFRQHRHAQALREADALLAAAHKRRAATDLTAPVRSVYPEHHEDYGRRSTDRARTVLVSPTLTDMTLRLTRIEAKLDRLLAGRED